MLEVGTVLQFLVLFWLGLPVAIFAIYGSILFYYSRRKKNSFLPDYGKTDFEPFVSIVVPTHNEESIISKRIENLISLNYAREKLEMIFVDDSDDSTPNIILKYAKSNPRLSLVRFTERMGYSPSMIAGCKKAKGEIVVLGDAGSFLDPQAIQNFVVHFQDPTVGAVTGQDVIMNANEQVGKSENLYLRILNFLRTAESNMDSTFYIKGEATAVRSCLVKDLENCSATYDTAVGLFARQKGFRTVYDPTVKFYEYAPLTHSDRVKQKTIRAANLIRIIYQFRHLMFKREYGKYGFVILPMNFAMLAIAPVALLVGFLVLIPTTFFNLTFSATIWGIAGGTLLLALVLSRNLLRTFLDLESSLLKALYEIAIHKSHDKIDKVASTRRSA
jgi:cellulose synthase/poly-beta-1,6-N-acetylglucosamine synthase-like glycosyltransferase